MADSDLILRVIRDAIVSVPLEPGPCPGVDEFLPDLDGYDSLAAIAVITALEAELGFEIPLSLLTDENFGTIREMHRTACTLADGGQL
jgi:hypothetical protein